MFCYAINLIYICMCVCLCVMLEFAVLYKSASSDGCESSTLYGSVLYLILAIFYFLIFCISTYQEIRIVKYVQCKAWLMAVEHILVASLSAIRWFTMLMYYKLNDSVGVTTFHIIAGVPQLISTWIFTFLIVSATTTLVLLVLLITITLLIKFNILLL